ncbi:3-ketoacyl-CoA thiolase 5, peroxisomal [Capsicum chinense]|nr:3-ketoacyl-CoA thiolase 5, peroxisomal [Capsicum chinense]
MFCRAYRTAICKFKRGGFKDILSEYDLLAPVLKAVIEKINLNPDEAGDIVVGTVLTPGSIRAMECRIAAFYASFPGSGADEHIELSMWLRALIAQTQRRNYQGRALPLS